MHGSKEGASSSRTCPTRLHLRLFSQVNEICEIESEDAVSGITVRCR